MAAWMVFAAVGAARELRADVPVQGLFRLHLPPHRTAAGWLLDPRPGGMRAELRARFSRSTAEAPEPEPTIAAWETTLAALGLEARRVDDVRWDGTPPRLRLTAAGPQLLIDLFGVTPVVFDPALGVLLIDREALPPATAEWALLNARELPW
ncbi:MAG: hypothetical protein KC620_11530 [Myxococcales bacterium]|nr:hypothetical protein [Myxococcales bacterium]